MVTISPHGEVASDRVHLPFRSFDRLAVSIYVPDLEPLPTKHWDANATSYSSPPGSGDLSKQPGNAAFSMPTDAWLYVDAIDVRASGSAGAVVAFGDSITDGFVAASPASEPVSLAIADKNGRYPDDLQRRINAASLPLSVVNAGIGSNRLVTDGEPLFLGPSGVQRFRRDALDVAGVRGVIVQEGINDLGIPPATTTPADLIAGYRTLITMAHAAHVKIWLGTILPASNAVFDGTALAPKSERYREQVNRWIRHQHQADGVIDFAARLRDPAIHTVLNPRYSGPDHLHPNLAGYRVMARTAKLGLLATALRK
jgi:lysophospholipase L1-like esterase